MSVIDSFKFWKKEEEQPAGTPQWAESEGPQQFQNEPIPPPQEEHFTPQAFSPPNFPSSSPPAAQPPQRDSELILARLDAIKAQLEALNARVAHLERVADSQQKSW